MAQVIINKAGGGKTKIEKVEGLQAALDSKIPYQAFEVLQNNTDFNTITTDEVNTLRLVKFKVDGESSVNQPLKSVATVDWYLACIKPESRDDNALIQYAFNVMSSDSGMTASANIFIRERTIDEVSLEPTWSSWRTFSTSELTGSESFYQKPVHFSVEGTKIFANFFDGTSQIKKELGSLVTSSLTATQADVLEGKTFGGYESEDAQVGTMPDYSTSSQVVRNTFVPSQTTQNYTIPKGYYEGDNVVVCDPVELTGTANAGDVLVGKSFYKDSLTKVDGTMVNNAGVTIRTTEVSGDGASAIRMKVPTDAYYSTTSYLDTPASTFGTATTSDVVSGKTFTSAEGFNVNGTFEGQSKSVNPATSAQTITPDVGKYLSEVIVNNNPSVSCVLYNQYSTSVNQTYNATRSGIALMMYYNRGSLQILRNGTQVASADNNSASDWQHIWRAVPVEGPCTITYKFTKNSDTDHRANVSCWFIYL